MAYSFVKSQAATQQFMVPQLTYCGDSDDDGGVPDTPYQCTNCYRQFREVSAMMQHMVTLLLFNLLIKGILYSERCSRSASPWTLQICHYVRSYEESRKDTINKTFHNLISIQVQVES